MKTAIVTSLGQDATILGRQLLKRGYKVIMTFRRSNDCLANTIKIIKPERYPNSSLHFVYCDVADIISVKQLIQTVILDHGKIDEFYNLAAQSHVGYSFQNPLQTLQSTGIAVFNILETLRTLQSQVKFFQASTSEMFGGDPKNGAFNEKSPFETRSPYAIAKLLAYNWVQYYRQTYNMFVCSAFTFNHSVSIRPSTFYIAKVCAAAANISYGSETKLKLGNIDHYRDESWACFVCEMFWKMLQLETPQDFVLSRDRCFHGEEYLDHAFKYFNLNWRDYVVIDDNLKRPNEVVKLVGDSRLAQKVLGWNPERMSFEDHIGYICEYHKQINLGNEPEVIDALEKY